MDITQLIPQRDPIIMVDDIRLTDTDSAITSLTIGASNWFVEGDHLLEAGLVEHVAQSAAALVGMAAADKGEAPHLGFIGSVQDFAIHALPKVGATIQTRVHIAAVVEEITLVEATLCVEDQTIATGRMKVFVQQ